MNILNIKDNDHINDFKSFNEIHALLRLRFHQHKQYLSYLIKNENNLHIIMDTVDIDIGQAKIDVNGVPFNKWFLVVIRLENKVFETLETNHSILC